MSTYRELMELAAKAAGIDVSKANWGGGRDGFYWLVVDNSERVEYWNPLINDGDALRLAVKLNIDLTHSWSVVNGDDNYPMASIYASSNEENSFYELKGSDPYAATRRAIVYVAAEIGREMK